MPEMSPRHGQAWTWEETLAAFNLYSKMPFGQIHHGNQRVVGLAKLLGRTPDSVAMKMVNLATHDPVHKTRGVKGLTNASKKELQVWEEPMDQVLYEGERYIAQLKGVKLEVEYSLESVVADMPEGRERETIVKTRVNQKIFHDVVFSSYADACCITGIDLPPLLVASHIVPWSKNPKERLNPRNGLCLNALHDRAFDRGLISVDPSFTVRVSRKIQEASAHSKEIRFIAKFDGTKIREPWKFAPQPELLEYHYRNIFVDAL